MSGLVGGPAVPEEGDGDEAGEEDARREAHLGLGDAVVGLGHPHNRQVRDLGHDGERGHETHAQADVRQPSDLGGPVVRADEDGRDGRE